MKISRRDRIACTLLAAAAAVAVLIEQGVTDGLWILGGIAYASSLLMATSALFSSIALKKIAFDRLDSWLALFSVGFAVVVALSAQNRFPLIFISSISVVAAAIIWTFARLTNRLSAK